MTLSDHFTYYDILDIKPDASPQEVREAYVRVKATYNRDSVALYTIVTADEREEALKQIEEAYHVLSDPNKRRNYDERHGLIDSPDNPFQAKPMTPPPATVVSIDRIPPMESMEDGGDSLLIPPNTDFAVAPETPVKTSQLPPKAPPTAPSAQPQAEPSKTDSQGHRHEYIPIKVQSHSPQSTNMPFTSYRPKSDSRGSYPNLDDALLHSLENQTEWAGSFLKKIREAYQISLEEMATITKVTKTYIRAIEEENYSKLPAAVYIRGFVSQIAKTLKLPHEKVANAYLARYHRTKTE
jgi:curved DNA-binding protein CbpA